MLPDRGLEKISLDEFRIEKKPPTPIGAVLTSDYAHGVAVAGSYVYVADENGGLAVIKLLEEAE